MPEEIWPLIFQEEFELNFLAFVLQTLKFENFLIGCLIWTGFLIINFSIESLINIGFGWYLF